jgi:putative oxidoreductase
MQRSVLSYLRPITASKPKQKAFSCQVFRDPYDQVCSSMFIQRHTMLKRIFPTKATLFMHADGLGLLALRLWASYEFLMAGLAKLQDLTPPTWFMDLPFPFPHTLLSAPTNWIAAGLLETVLGTTLLLGLFSRWSSAILLYVTYVAVYTVHFDLGWRGWNQIDTEQGLGFKVPLMLALMLWTVLTQGAGRFSLDHLHEKSQPH